jgi:hypothetical protein
MKIIILILCLIPTLVESWLDRKGESRKGKVKDSVWLIVVAIALAGASWWIWKSNPLVVLLLILMFRFCCFDYITNAFLKRYSEGHKNINIFTFTGTTAFTDRITAKINPWLRFGIRLALFLGSLILSRQH